MIGLGDTQCKDGFSGLPDQLTLSYLFYLHQIVLTLSYQEAKNK